MVIPNFSGVGDRSSLNRIPIEHTQSFRVQGTGLIPLSDRGFQLCSQSGNYCGEIQFAILNLFTRTNTLIDPYCPDDRMNVMTHDWFIVCPFARTRLSVKLQIVFHRNRVLQIWTVTFLEFPVHLTPAFRRFEACHLESKFGLQLLEFRLQCGDRRLELRMLTSKTEPVQYTYPCLFGVVFGMPVTSNGVSLT
jgi:hypothetical protein